MADYTSNYTGPEIDARLAKAHEHSNKALLDSYTQTEADIADAVSKKHTHSNKALLDSYTQTEANIADAVSKKHGHSNKSVLDAITDVLTTAWSAASTWVTTNGATVLTHLADTVKHITASERSAWNGKQEALVSGTNLKTINNQSLLGSGNIDIQGGGTSDFDALSNRPSYNGSAMSHATNIPEVKTAAWDGKYSKPSGGIPSTDMSSDVQTSLGKADSALQSHQSLAAYRTAAQQDAIHDATKQDVIGDLGSIRSGAALGATSLQPVSGSHTNEIAILDSGGNIRAGGKTLSDLIEQPAVAGTDGQVLTSDGQGGVAWETPQGGGGDTSTIQEVSATALEDLNWRVNRINNGNLKVGNTYKQIMTVEDYRAIYGSYINSLDSTLAGKGLAAAQGKYLKDLSDVNEQILANALVELALGVTIWRNIAAEFSPSTAYNVGDYCFYSGILYRCTTSASASPTFDNTKFEQTTVMAEIIRLTTNA